MIKIVLAASAAAAVGGVVLTGFHAAAAALPDTPGTPTSSFPEQTGTPYTTPPGWPYEIDFEGVTGPVSFETDAQRAIPPSDTDLSTIEVGGSAEHY